MGQHQCWARSKYGTCRLEQGHEESHETTVTSTYLWDAVVCAWCGYTEAEHNAVPRLGCAEFETYEHLQANPKDRI